MFRRAALLSIFMLLAVLLGTSSALAAEGLTGSPDPLDFGAVDMHGGSPRQSVQFFNETLSAVSVSSAATTGADASAFQIVEDDCSSATLEPSEKCSIEVEFHPASGPQSASLELLDAGEAVLATVPLSGEGITGTLSASPDPLSFSPIPYTPPGHEGEYQETDQVNVLNSNAGTQIESVNITGPDASSFSIQYGNCEHTLLAPGNNCDVGIRFAASSPGPKSASLVLGSDSSGTPLVVPLEAEALRGPEISVASTQALLGDVLLGSSAQHTFTLTNTGDYPLVIQQDFMISGTPLMFPISSDTCGGHMLGPGGSCELTVGFQPTTPGEKDASIILITNASPIHVLGIDGVGVLPVSNPLSSTLTPQATDAPAGPAPLPPPLAPPASSRVTGDLLPALAARRSPRLYSWSGRAVLDTGLIARCPAQLPLCSTVSFITASIPAGSARISAGRARSRAVLLGSALSGLRGGHSTDVRVNLRPRAITLLRRQGRLHVRIETIIQAGGTVVAERTGAMTLDAASIARVTG